MISTTPYTTEEIVELVQFVLRDKAAIWDIEASEESQKGAADRSKIGTLRWGAGQLRAIADELHHVPLTFEYESPDDPEDGDAEGRRLELRHEYEVWYNDAAKIVPESVSVAVGVLDAMHEADSILAEISDAGEGVPD